MRKPYGVKGWLLFFVLILVVIQPLYSLFDLIENPSFYSYYSGTYSLTSLLWVFGLLVWGVYIGISIWNKKEKAIVWAKEYLIVSVVLGVIFTFFYFSLYTFEEQTILMADLFRSLVFFGIWFFYLNVSKRVANTFKIRKLEWKRLGIIFLIVLGILFLITIVSSLFPQNIESGGIIISGSQEEFTQTDNLEGWMANYHEFSDQNLVTDVIVSFESTYPITVFIVKSEYDFDKFIEDKDYEIYDSCFIEEQSSGEIKCTVSSGGIVLWNYNDVNVEYSLTIK